MASTDNESMFKDWLLITSNKELKIRGELCG